jgi:hypothetical protein
MDINTGIYSREAHGSLEDCRDYELAACYCDHDQPTCESLKHPVSLQRNVTMPEVFHSSDPEARVIESPLDHVMIDIETMSLSKHNALLLSIGMIEFDPTPLIGPVIGQRSLIIPSITLQLALGREVSPSTQKWWRDQTPEARDHWENFPDNDRRSLTGVCKDIRSFVNGRQNVWANGIQFDLVNLEVLAAQVGEREDLWHYRAPADMRSFCRHTPQTRIMEIGNAIDMEKEGVPHHPVYDCIVQAHQVWQHWPRD